MTHTLHVTRVHDDGHREEWTAVGIGYAAKAHAALAKRWRAAGYDHERDRHTLTLTRHHDAGEHGGLCVETVTHDPRHDDGVAEQEDR